MNKITKNRPIVVGWVVMMTLATVVMAGATVVIGKAEARQAAKNVKQDAIREAAATSAFNDCLRSIPTLQAISTHISGVNDLASILLANSKRSLAALPREAPDRAARIKNLAALKRALVKVRAVKKLDVPSEGICAARRNISAHPPRH